MYQIHLHKLLRITTIFVLLSALFILFKNNNDKQQVHAAPTACGNIFISEYIEGSSNNKAIEIFNGTGNAEILTGIYTLEFYFNGSTSAGLTFSMNGTLNNNDVFVVAHSLANAAIISEADLTSGSGFFNGDDTVVLRKNGQIIDIIGQIGSDPGTEWGTGVISTADNTIRRKSSISNGDSNGSDTFDPAIEWDGFATDTFAGVGTHTADCSSGGTDVPPTVSSTSPVNGATAVPTNSAITINFSEAVTASASAFSLECPGSTPVSFSTSPSLPGSGSSFTLTPATNLPNSTTCQVTVTAANIADQDAPINNMATNYSFSFTSQNASGTTYIHDVQGAGASVAIAGTVTVEGVVVGDYQAATELRGFFLQEEDTDTDANPATSEGIFVYCNGCTTAVSEGQIVSVTGTASDRFDNSEIDATATGGSVSVTDAGNNIALATAAALDLPVPAGFTNVADYYEQFEGMLVSFVDELTVTEYFELARYGQIVLSQGGKTQQFTHTSLPSAAGYTAHLDEMARRRIILDDVNNTENNTDPVFHPQPGGFSVSNYVRGGYTIPNLKGVLHYSWAGSGANAFRIRPQKTNPIVFTANNLRPAAPTPSGEVTVASFNVLNYFNGNGSGGGFPTSRGADSAAEFTRQHNKIVNAIIALNADIIGLMEIENDGYGSNSAIQDLVDGLNASAGAGTYAFVNAGGPMGSDEIAVGLLYKPAAVTPVGTTAVLDDPDFVDPLNSGSDRNRPALVQTFQVSDNSLQSYGGVFTVIVNHLKSKGSICGVGDDDPTTGQANCNGSRTGAVDYLVNTWLPTDPTDTTTAFGFHDTDYLIIGDLNAYALENPITTITDAGYTNLLNAFQGTAAYSYVFDGEWGYLDHALTSSSLTSQVQSAAHWHINADESSLLDYNDGILDSGEASYEAKPSANTLYANDAYRASDHDPLIVSLNLKPTADYGDLNNSYGTAWHTGLGELRLGSAWSAEEGNTTNDGDDGVEIGPGTGPQGQWQDGLNGGSLLVEVNDTVNGTATGCFYAWIDWDESGTFADPGERVINGETGGSGAYSFNVPNGTFQTPPPSVPNPPTAYAIRVRLYEACSSGPIGQGFGGEMEDFSQDFTPTAVTLQSIHATSQNTLWLAMLLVIVTLLSGSLLMWLNGRSERSRNGLH